MSQAIQPATAEPTFWERHLVVLCALMAGAARFVPLPFLDDLVRERIYQLVVSRLLKRVGRGFGSRNVPPLWRDPESCQFGCASLLWRVPLKLLLFPIRKLITLLTSVQGFARDAVSALLFGRAVTRALELGRLPDGLPAPALESEAQVIRNAFVAARQTTDTTLISAALSGALGEVKGLLSGARRAARTAARAQAAGQDGVAAVGADPTLQEGAGVVEAVLARPDVAQALAQFDARFDAALSASAAPSPQPGPP